MRTPPLAIRQPRAARLLPLAAAFALAFTVAPAAQAITITVTSNADSGGSTLRAAILAANTACDTGVSTAPIINFSGPFTISPSSPLPTFFCSVAAYTPTIDGGGTPAAPRVVLDGAGSGASCGLNSNVNFAYGGDLTVLGMKFQNFTYGSFAAGVCGTSVILKGNLFTNNSIGTWMTNGSSTVGGPLASDRNVFASSPGKGLQVSGPAAATIENNVFTGNSDAGIFISGGSATIQDNLVGTANGTSSSGNGTGIYLNSPSSANIRGNLISGNTGVGLDISNDYGGSVVFENRIGTNADGTAALRNLGGGVVVRNSFLISMQNNLISGNSNAGVSVDNSNYIFLQNNRIGSTAGGAPLANTRGLDAFCSGYVDLNSNTIATNTFEGVFFGNVDQSFVYGNTIEDNGGTGFRIAADLDCRLPNGNTLDSNTIRNNGQNGVLLTGGTGNGIFAGSITGNALKNININNTNSGPLPNDSGDSDGGPNNQQNWPVVDSVVQSGGQTIISFTLNSGFSTYNIQAYANSAFGKPGGETYLENTSICGDCNEFSGTITVNGLYDNISLTASDGGNTSEFSPMKRASTAPAVVVRPATLNFGDILIGSTSGSRASTLTSVGDQAYDIDVISSSGCYGGPICYGGAFICQTTCDTAASYGRNQSCQISAQFKPLFPGPTSTTIYICDNASGSPRSILLQGTGVPPPPIVVSPTSWDFGNVPVAVLSARAGFVIRNQSISFSSISLGPITATGEFEMLDSTCGASLAYGASCDANVGFLPTQSGQATGELVVPYVECCSEVAKPQSVRAALTGNGVSGGELALPSAIEVGAASVGGGPISTTVELVNTGTAPVTIYEVAVSSPFTVLNNCTTPLAPGAACTLVIGFTAPGVGSFNGSLTVVSDASGGSGVVPVHATGQTIAAPLIVVTPFSVGFGDRIIGSSTASQAITLTNIGGVAATLSLATSSVDFIIAGNNCGATLEPRASCFAQVAFRPLGFGLRLSSFIVTSNSSNSPQSVSLSGTGCRPYLASGNRSGVPSNCAP